MLGWELVLMAPQVGKQDVADLRAGIFRDAEDCVERGKLLKAKGGRFRCEFSSEGAWKILPGEARYFTLFVKEGETMIGGEWNLEAFDVATQNAVTDVTTVEPTLSSFYKTAQACVLSGLRMTLTQGHFRCGFISPWDSE